MQFETTCDELGPICDEFEAFRGQFGDIQGNLWRLVMNSAHL